MLKVDPQGFDEIDRRLLRPDHRDTSTAARSGSNRWPRRLSEERGTIEDVIEPYLIQQGYLVRTARGRMAIGQGLAPSRAEAAHACQWRRGQRHVRGGCKWRLNCSSVGRHGCIGKIPTPVAWSTTRSTWHSSSARAPNGCARAGKGQAWLRDETTWCSRCGRCGSISAARAPGRCARCRGRRCAVPAREPGDRAGDPRDGELLLDAEVRVAALNASDFRPRAIPDALHDELKSLKQFDGAQHMIPLLVALQRPPSNPCRKTLLALRRRPPPTRCPPRQPRYRPGAARAACEHPGAAGDAAAAVRVGRVVADHLPQEARARSRRRRTPSDSRSASGPARNCRSLFAGASERGRVTGRPGSDLRSRLPRIRPPAPAQAASTARIQLEGAQRAMRATASREMDRLEHNLEFLASVGSISPTSACSARCGAS